VGANVVHTVKYLLHVMYVMLCVALLSVEF